MDMFWMDKIKTNENTTFFPKKNKSVTFLFLIVLCYFSTITCSAESNSFTHIMQSDSSASSADVVIFACFAEDTAESASYYFNELEKYSTIKDYFMGESGRSFADYMSAISYGKYTVNVCFPQERADGTILPITIPISQESAKKQNMDAQIVQAVMDSMPSLSEYAVDRDMDGYIDNITIICKADDCSEAESGSSLVSHANISGSQGLCQGYGVCKYNMISTDRLEDGQSALLAHEYLHTLGYPDLYRTDGSKDYPVYLWDIMGAVSYAPTYPLAFLRSEITKWFSIQTITEDGTYCLNNQKDSTGNKALIIKSPLSDTEIFVVEYRQRPTDIIDHNTLDRPLPGSGIIVYRVNKTVEEYSNAHGETGIYVFRPQFGQAGYIEGNPATTVANAYLSQESGRTSIGSLDGNATLEDGALTFSDGSNSGILISEVGSASGDSITFKVTYPDLSTADLWEDASFSSSTANMYEKIRIAFSDDNLFALEYDGSGFNLYKYKDNRWSKISDPLSVDKSSFNQNMRFLAKGNSLYLAYGDWDSNLYLKRFNLATGNWTHITKIADKGENFDLCFHDNNLYLSYGSDSLKLAKIEGSSVKDLGVAYQSSWLMGSSKLLSIDGSLYLFGRDASNNQLLAYEYNDGNIVNYSNNLMKGNTFDVIYADGKIYMAYVSSSNSKLCMAVYENKKWTITESARDSSDLALGKSNNNIFVLSSPSSGKESFCMYFFHNGTFAQEGDRVIDAASGDFSVIDHDNILYLSYVRNNDFKSFVKFKKVSKTNTDADDIDKKDDICVNHRWNVGLITTPASCNKIGVKIYTCDLCNIIRKETISKLPHVQKKVTNRVSPSNTSVGFTEGYRCSRCGLTTGRKTIPRISQVTLYKGINKSYQLSKGKWTLSKTKVAKIKGNKISIKKTGRVKATDKNTGLSVIIRIVKPKLILNASKIKLRIGKKYQIKQTSIPAGSPTYKSSNTSVVTVNKKGIITSKKSGKANITVKCNGITKKIQVVVYK